MAPFAIKLTIMAIRGMSTSGLAGLTISDWVMKIQPGKQIKLETIWPEKSEFRRMGSPALISDLAATPYIVQEKDTPEYTFRAFRIDFQNSGIPTLLQIRLSLPKMFPGRLVVQPVAGIHYMKDINLESIKFNKKTIVQAETAKVAYQILSPDFMDWYLGLTFNPIFYFKDNVCNVTILEKTLWKKEDVDSFMALLYENIIDTGSLNQKTRINK